MTRYFSSLFLCSFLLLAGLDAKNIHPNFPQTIQRTQLPSLKLKRPLFAHETIKDQLDPDYFDPSIEKLKLRLDNGLEVFLISDPEVETSGAALSVEAGCWDDPSEFPGMAHFVEHLLFMGTEAYPQETEYQEFLVDRGGELNAFTLHDRTVYGFAIDEEPFSEALDRFSHFFIDPLLNPSSIAKEIHAVDHEFGDNYEDIFSKFWRIFKETGNKSHPNAHLSIGNKQSLAGVTQKDVKKWYEAHYCPEKMHLFVISSLPVEKLQSLVVKKFSKIPLREKRKRSLDISLSTENQKGHLIHVSGNKKENHLFLLWEIPKPFSADFEKKAAKLLTLALAHSEEKSLFKLLKKENLIDDLNIDGWQIEQNHLLFGLQLELTEKGLSEVDRVIQRCYEGLSLLKQKIFPIELFDQYQTLQRKKVIYQSPVDLYDFIMNKASSMIDEELETYPEKTFVPTQYDPLFLQDFADCLAPDTCIYFLIADPQKTKIVPNAVEKWMNTPYLIRDIPQEKLQKWNDIQPQDQIDFPSNNPCHLWEEILLEEEEKEEEELYTEKEEEECFVLESLEENETAHIDWSNEIADPCTVFRLDLLFETPLIDGSLMQKVLTDLFVISLSQKLKTGDFSDLQQHCKLSLFEQNSSLNMVLVCDDLETLDNLDSLFFTLRYLNISPEEFKFSKEILLKAYQNHSSALDRAFESLDSILLQKIFTQKEKRKVLKEISLKDFNYFSAHVLEKAFINGMLAANLSSIEADHLWKKWKSILNVSTYQKQDKKTGYFIFPENENSYAVLKESSHHGHALALVLELSPAELSLWSTQQILNVVLKTAFFDEMRTKQQLVYSAVVDCDDFDDRLFQFFGLQSSTHDPFVLLRQCESFLDSFVRTLSSRVSKKRFEVIKNALVRDLSKKWEELQENEESGLKDLIKSLENLSYSQFQEDAILFFKDNPKRLAVLLKGKNIAEHSSASSTLPSAYELVSKEELSSWKKFVINQE